jgi:uncharacterized protein
MPYKFSGFSITITVILVLITILVFMLLFIVPGLPGKLPLIRDNSEMSIREPVFRRDGTVRFLQNGTRKVLFEGPIEVAQTPESQKQGLMYRKSMPDSAGMLFVFGVAEQLIFWMKNTIIPLDIIYADPAKKIVRIARNTKPYSEDPIPSGKVAMFVLEMNAGFALKHGLNEGDLIDFKY